MKKKGKTEMKTCEKREGTLECPEVAHAAHGPDGMPLGTWECDACGATLPSDELDQWGPVEEMGGTIGAPGGAIAVCRRAVCADTARACGYEELVSFPAGDVGPAAMDDAPELDDEEERCSMCDRVDGHAAWCGPQKEEAGAEADLEAFLVAALSGEPDPLLLEDVEGAVEVRACRTFAEDGVLTSDLGVVVELADGREYQIRIVRSR